MPTATVEASGRLRFPQGPALKKARERWGSREELACKVSRTAATVASWERGTVRPPPHLLVRLESILDVDLGCSP